MANTCTAKKKDGGDCHARVVTGSDTCFTHRVVAEAPVVEALAEAPPAPVEVPVIPENPGGKKLGIVGRSTDQGLRGVVVAVAECAMPTVVHGRTEYTTGPCQQAVKDNPSLARTWFKTCTHGPEFVLETNAEGRKVRVAIPPNLRPYYETAVHIKRTPILNEDGTIKEWEETTVYDAKLRLKYVAVDTTINSGRSLKRVLARGAKLATEFNIAPFCENHGCFRQDVKRYRNGLYCSDNHAAFVYARATATFVPLGGFDQSWPMATSSMKRQEVLAKLRSEVAV